MEDFESIYRERMARFDREAAEQGPQKTSARETRMGESNTRKLIRKSRALELDEEVGEMSEGDVFTFYLAQSDHFRKKGRLVDSIQSLVKADLKYNPGSDNEESSRRYQALLNRAKRIFDKADNDRVATEACYVTIKSLSERTGLRPYSPSIATKAAAILGIGLGAIFLSSNVTGNVIGNLSLSTSNILGALLLSAGIVGAYFWSRR